MNPYLLAQIRLTPLWARRTWICLTIPPLVVYVVLWRVWDHRHVAAGLQRPMLHLLWLWCCWDVAELFDMARPWWRR